MLIITICKLTIIKVFHFHLFYNMDVACGPGFPLQVLPFPLQKPPHTAGFSLQSNAPPHRPATVSRTIVVHALRQRINKMDTPFCYGLIIRQHYQLITNRRNPFFTIQKTKPHYKGKTGNYTAHFPDKLAGRSYCTTGSQQIVMK